MLFCAEFQACVSLLQEQMLLGWGLTDVFGEPTLAGVTGITLTLTLAS